jgi:Uma2 family endonuclease
MLAPTHAAATAAELMAIPEDERFHEIVAGELVRKAEPSGEHGGTQADIAAWLGTSGFGRRGRGDGTAGGWRFATGVEIELGAHEVYRPDVLGWRRERVPDRPRGTPVRIRPDWICEVLSPKTARRDRGRKLEGYHRAGVPHYWLVDPVEETLTVHRWAQEGYLVVLTAERGQRVRAEPFEAVELQVSEMFGDNPQHP